MSSIPPGNGIGVALVGTGSIARAWHLPAWSRRPDARLRWAVDVDADAARDAASEWRVPSWTTELAKVLEDPDVNVVDLCTPPEVHAEQTRAVLAAGKHVLVEKPAASTLAEVRAMADAAEAASASGAVAMVAENWLFCTGMSHARELIARGELGELTSVVVTLETAISLGRTPDQQRSILLNAGVHAVNVVRHLLGEPTQVSAFSLLDKASALAGPEADTALAVSLRCVGEDGRARIASLHLSGHAHRPKPGARRVRVLGSEGIVEFDVFGGWVEWSGPAWSGVRRFDSPDPHTARGQAEELDHFLAAVRGEATVLSSLRDQLRTHEVLAAIWRSAQELSTVEVCAP